MAEIRPFRGWRYDLSRIGSLEPIIAPPYDVLSLEQAKDLWDRHPYNVTRIILGDPSGVKCDESADPARHEKATSTFEKWKRSGILVQDAEPSVYLVEDRFEWRGSMHQRRGILCLVHAEELNRGIILPHERTLAAPIADRFRLLSLSRAHLSPVYMLCEDPDRTLRSQFEKTVTDAPLARIRNRDAALEHRMWKISDRRVLESIAETVRSRPFLIADGHHRYTTALAYAKEQGGELPEASWILIYLAPVPDPGVVLSSIHRMVQAPPIPLEVLEKIASIRTGKVSWESFEKDKAPLALLNGNEGDMRLLASWKADSLIHPDLRNVPSVLLNDGILRPICGLHLERTEDQRKVKYAHDANEVVQTLAKSGGIGFWLRPLEVTDVLRVAEAGHVLPQKSTYFFPKVMDGFVMHTLDP
ncbi:MAG TPA: DUF1015 domain-containing protein [Bdellovibrionota bacterium]|nr:DUF1015 domain-containing protein [Bdellovibrionota bacterium]